jgi:hypothetical protein
MLSNFQLGDQALLQSFLVGQPELRAMMQGPQMQQLRQRVIASYHLGPLDKSETQAYVEHRLKHVAWKGDPRFEPACFDVIHALTGGIPRRINTLCNRLLLATFLAERHAIETSDVETIAREIGEEMGSESALSEVAVIDRGRCVGSSWDGMAAPPPVSDPDSEDRTRASQYLFFMNSTLTLTTRRQACSVSSLQRGSHSRTAWTRQSSHWS